MAQPVPTKVFLCIQPVKTAAMYMAPRAYKPTLPPILLAHNESIAPSDNVWPKSDDEYTPHQWLKGQIELFDVVYDLIYHHWVGSSNSALNRFLVSHSLQVQTTFQDAHRNLAKS